MDMPHSTMLDPIGHMMIDICIQVCRCMRNDSHSMRFNIILITRRAHPSPVCISAEHGVVGDGRVTLYDCIAQPFYQWHIITHMCDHMQAFSFHYPRNELNANEYHYYLLCKWTVFVPRETRVKGRIREGCLTHLSMCTPYPRICICENRGILCR